MITAYTAAAWTGLASTVAEAAATLTGLVFVAVSINLRQILAYPHLPGRAGRRRWRALLAGAHVPDRHRVRAAERVGAAGGDHALAELSY
jgi:hypothetical protein